MPKLIYGKKYRLKQNLYNFDERYSNILLTEKEIKDCLVASKGGIYEAHEDQGLYPIEENEEGVKTTEISYSVNNIENMYIRDDIFELYDN